MSEWSSCHAGLNEAGNFLIEITEASISSSLVEQLSKVNLQWAERMKKTVFVSFCTRSSTNDYTLQMRNDINVFPFYRKYSQNLKLVPLLF